MDVALSFSFNKYLQDNGFIPVEVRGEHGAATMFMDDAWSFPLPDIGGITCLIPVEPKSTHRSEFPFWLDGRTTYAKRLKEIANSRSA